ncbi:MAG TPA: hypothetical protein VGS96_16120 [Thermoanaerobaculia bacterium]|jgi:hypothetical protein|nr:hypothetical protein [Thermoanaerobaculia bacterium]
MAIAVKEITLWRREVENRPGTMASTLAPLTEAGANFRVVMGYRYPGDESKAAVEIFPVAGKKQIAAAQQAGLSPAEFPALIVEGDDRPGLGHRFASSVADAGINMSFLVAQVVGRKYSAIFGFETKEDARAAAAVIKKAAAKR